MHTIRSVALGVAVAASLVLAIFLYTVFSGIDFPLLHHITPVFSGENMAWTGLAAGVYLLIQGMSIAIREAVDPLVVFIDIASSLAALIIVVLFGWVGLIVGSHHPTTFSMWTLVIFTVVTIADGVFNGYISLRFLPRWFQVGHD